MRKIILTGPESSGKTTLANSLAELFNLPCVEEYAREYIRNLNRKYTFNDLEIIAKKQNTLIENATGDNIIICDTDILTIIIWAGDKFGMTPLWMEAYFLNDQDSVYFLCEPDFDWVPDIIREDADRRDLLFDKYKSILIKYNKRFYAIGGTVEERIQHTAKILRNLIY